MNLWAKDTIEEYVIDLLDKKINMFQLVVGELDLVLGRAEEERTFEEVLMDIWTVKDIARRREELQRYGERLLAAKGQYDISVDVTGSDNSGVSLLPEPTIDRELAAEASP